MSASAEGPHAPPGWYVQGNGKQRYWDGESWTDQYAPASVQPVMPMAPVQPQSRASDGLVIAAYITAVVIPLIGLILGIAVAIKNRVALGMGAVGLSIIAWIVWIAALTSGSSS